MDGCPGVRMSGEPLVESDGKGKTKPSLFTRLEIRKRPLIGCPIGRQGLSQTFSQFFLQADGRGKTAPKERAHLRVLAK